MQNKGRDMRQTKHGVKRVGAETSNPAEKHKASPGRGRGMGGGGGGSKGNPHATARGDSVRRAGKPDLDYSISMCKFTFSFPPSRFFFLLSGL